MAPGCAWSKTFLTGSIAINNSRACPPGNGCSSGYCPPRRHRRAMNLSLADKIAQAILYEGYVLYPYRPDTYKNRQRWTFGGLFPRGYSDGERWFSQSEWLVLGDGHTTLDFHVRCLQLQQRAVGQPITPVSAWDPASPPPYCQVETLVVGERTLSGWQEAVEGAADFTGLSLADFLARPASFDFALP